MKKGYPINPHAAGSIDYTSHVSQVLWICDSDRPWHRGYAWDLAAAGSVCVGNIFSNRKTLHRSCWPEQKPFLKDAYVCLGRLPPD